MYKVKIESLDDFGRGIAHLDNKVIFVKNALPLEEVEIEIEKEEKSYAEAKVVKYYSFSEKRWESKCPYFGICGGCNLLFFKYEDTLEYKRKKVEGLLKKNKVRYGGEIEVIKNKQPFNYRDKLSLEISKHKIGFYQEKTHELVEIKECIVASKAINQVIENFELLHINNGNLTIRSNLNNEVLLVIESEEHEQIDIAGLKEKVKLLGIIYNQKLIYGQSFYYERIYNHLFKVSYDAFFQVNPNGCEEIFKLIENNIGDNQRVLDLYCGVGTLGIVASHKAKEVWGVEIVKHAILDAVLNAKLNKVDNIEFMVGDVQKSIDKLPKCFDTLIVDPPRKGLDKKVINYILDNNFKNIIYISCDINTLIRDLLLLEGSYEIKNFKVIDMFSYTYHVESFCVLNLR